VIPPLSELRSQNSRRLTGSQPWRTAHTTYRPQSLTSTPLQCINTQFTTPTITQITFADSTS